MHLHSFKSSVIIIIIIIIKDIYIAPFRHAPKVLWVESNTSETSGNRLIKVFKKQM